MLRKALGLFVLVCAGSLLVADSKGQEKKDDKPKDLLGIKVTLVKADVDKKILIVTGADGKKAEFLVDKDTTFYGPRGGVSDAGLKDDRLTVGAALRLVVEAKKLKEVHLPFRAKAGKDKDKKDDKKDKKDDKKDDKK
jgi:hypothetical protein